MSSLHVQMHPNELFKELNTSKQLNSSKSKVIKATTTRPSEPRKASAEPDSKSVESELQKRLAEIRASHTQEMLKVLEEEQSAVRLWVHRVGE